MRLIDADPLDRMGYVLTRTYQQDEKTMVYETKKLSDVPSITPEPQWIPCSERLPEYGKSVLCYFKEDEDFGVNHVIDEEDGEWFIDGVTAWMPLPEPWKDSEV